MLRILEEDMTMKCATLLIEQCMAQGGPNKLKSGSKITAALS